MQDDDIYLQSVSKQLAFILLFDTCTTIIELHIKVLRGLQKQLMGQHSLQFYLYHRIKLAIILLKHL